MRLRNETMALLEAKTVAGAVPVAVAATAGT
jgi:hypothetical protein